ncbi:hypothetical protein P3X46_033332 [Hevea brasiliensis]|uniref:Uncharacterized protein n=1 Tax=Hevea brasiliensis TaxID=3981 RepID=A0ABQ9KG39_HEVBR|nr:uncharacterized protein LOC110666728 [Hevea brasiliensis]KAJ9136237.1 hypothetical protein P3X46_033332 [Hevea brasiliensis]
MEGNEIPWEFNSVSALIRIEIMSAISSETIFHLSSNPLFSCIITLYALILIYFPHALKISLSTVLILSALLLLFLLRLGAIQRLHNKKPDENESKENNRDGDLDEAEKSSFLAKEDKWVAFQGETGIDSNPKPDFEVSFVEWDMRAPLEVIYEAYEGEEDEENDNEKHEDSDPTRTAALERYPSLSMYYPETDSDTSSDGGFWVNGEWDSPESVCFRWEEEDKAGLLIEIALDSNDKKQPGLGFEVEEDNLIEIDL